VIRGGNTNVGLWEARPLLYLPVVYVLVTNLLTSPRQYRSLMWWSMGAITVQSVLALRWYRSLPPSVRSELQNLTEHAAAVHMNALIVFLLAAWLIPGVARWMRGVLVIMAIPVVWAYFLGERRSAMVGLALGVILFAAALFHLHRRAFTWFVPVVALCSVAYLAAAWNVQSTLGFPAQAIKSAIAPGALEGADRSSAEYRALETINIHVTIEANPLRGVGFGHPFYRPFPLPDISFFPFWEYMPHLSFLWIWLKTGFAGFVAMLFLMIRTIQHGARSIFQMPTGELTAVALTAALYVPMYLVFSYVDIAWDIRSMVFMGFVMAVCADLARVVAREPPSPPASAPAAAEIVR
jgi:hypothetical protein